MYVKPHHQLVNFYTFFINIGLPLQQPYVIFDSPKFRRQTVITPYHIHAAEFHKQVLCLTIHETEFISLRHS